MPDQPSSTLVSDAEIDAALAEAETEPIPSLDDGNGGKIIPVPVESPQFRAAPRDVPAPTDSPGPSPTAPPAAAPVPAENPGVLPKSHGVGRLCYRAVDIALWALNRPFNWLSPGARRLTGAVAIVTLVTSLLAPYLLPLLSPPRHH